MGNCWTIELLLLLIMWRQLWYFWDIKTNPFNLIVSRKTLKIKMTMKKKTLKPDPPHEYREQNIDVCLCFNQMSSILRNSSRVPQAIFFIVSSCTLFIRYIINFCRIIVWNHLLPLSVAIILFLSVSTSLIEFSWHDFYSANYCESDGVQNTEINVHHQFSYFSQSLELIWGTYTGYAFTHLKFLLVYSPKVNVTEKQQKLCC